MGQNYDTGGALHRPFEAPTGTGTLFGQTMGLVAVTAAGYATRRDLSALARVLWWALIAVGVVLVFVSIPGGSVVYALLGLVIFAGLVMYDFQRLCVRNEVDSAPLLAASIVLDLLNVFQFFLSLRSESQLTAQTAPWTTRRT
jgi:FtsH-binding integral membrane protein